MATSGASMTFKQAAALAAVTAGVATAATYALATAQRSGLLRGNDSTAAKHSTKAKRKEAKTKNMNKFRKNGKGKSKVMMGEDNAGESDDSSDNDDDGSDNGEGKKATGERWDVKHEFYDNSIGWTVREPPDEEKTAVFTVSYRRWPKSADYSGQEDYTAVQIWSYALVDVLRRVLIDVEAVLEDEPQIDARELFLKKAEIAKLLKELEVHKAQLDAKRAEHQADVGEKSTNEESAEVNGELEQADASVLDTVEAQPDDSSQAAEDDNQEHAASTDELEVQIDHVQVMLQYLDKEFAPIQSKLDRMLQRSEISYPLLWAIFPAQLDVVTTDDASSEKTSMRVKDWSYSVNRDGPHFCLSGWRLVFNGDKYVRVWSDVEIPKFKGLRNIGALNAFPMTTRYREELTARGKRYTELAGVHFLNYSSVLIQRKGHGMDRRIIKMRAEGRAVVDAKSFRRMQPAMAAQEVWEDEEYDDYGCTINPGSSVIPPKGEHPADTELCLLPPCVYGFSLVAREFGLLLVDKFTPIEFNPLAYKHLVLDPNYKELILSLVKQNHTLSRARAIQAGHREKDASDGASDGQPCMISDVIQGKSGGLVIVLHGSPGTGKTLTAEAISDLLEAPLYSVTAGELGMSAETLEKKLRDVLDTVEVWSAVLLIDEADVFLEQRSLHDVARNAMVSVFLRMLEHHAGVLFLTTNRVHTIDPAFQSRFSVALSYPALDRSKRRTIWKAFLRMAGVGIEDEQDDAKEHLIANGFKDDSEKQMKQTAIRSYISAAYLSKLAAKTEFNGRSIKNVVRTAQALALSKGKPLGTKELDIVIETSQKFAQDFKEADVEGLYQAPGEGWQDRTMAYN
ncbi:hypothetical protein OIV83_004102 [Microbotryomycetes sp. JL201]|nr:hypothetical protein OIV83_004102 [Microbotryomycetes sp. JL201]